MIVRTVIVAALQLRVSQLFLVRFIVINVLYLSSGRNVATLIVHGTDIIILTIRITVGIPHRRDRRIAGSVKNKQQELDPKISKRLERVVIEFESQHRKSDCLPSAQIP